MNTRRTLGFVISIFLISCSPTRFYKPLKKNEQALSASFGGPLVKVPNVASIPIPFSSIGYARGISDKLTVYGSWQSTSAIFGVAHLDFGATHSIWKRDNMGLSAALGTHFLIDVFEWKPSLFPQLSANYYYTYRNNSEKDKCAELYVGTENWFDLRAQLAHDVPNTNRILWNMHLGHTFRKNKWSYQLELKLLAPYLNNDVVVDYISPFEQKGGFGIYFGVQRLIGKK